MNIRNIILITAGVALLSTACKSEYTTYEGENYIMFSAESHDIGILDSEEWFDIPVTATRKADHDRLIGVEVVAESSNAIEGYHYTLESNTLRIAAGELTTSLRIKGNPENISLTDSLGVALRLVIDKENIWDEYGIDTKVRLHKCCPADIDIFTGYAKLTSSWIMQYMGADARLVTTRRSAEEDDVIIINDMFYDGYDISIRLDSSDRLNPLVEMQPQTIGSTGEAFGTIYGNGKLEMMIPPGYNSYYGNCEKFLVLYTTMYVENVGTVGTYVNIFEWITDDEAERIINNGF